MFADFRVHGLNMTFFQCFHHRSSPSYRKEKGGLPPDFLWSLVALANFTRLSLLKAAHAVMSGAAYRKSGSPVLFNPCTLVRTRGTRPGGKAWWQARDLSHNERITLTPPTTNPQGGSLTNVGARSPRKAECILWPAWSTNSRAPCRCASASATAFYRRMRRRPCAAPASTPPAGNR
jgi:hypothetical protein